jgi:hypothetical protein
MNLTNQIPQNKAVNVALYFAGAVRQGEPGGDGGLVSADADGEGMQLGLIVGFHRGQPVFEVLPGALRQHLSKTLHMRDKTVHVRAAGPDTGEFLVLVGIEVARTAQQPAGDVADLRRCGRGGGCGDHAAELLR